MNARVREGDPWCLPAGWPPPVAAARRVSERLVAQLQGEIEAAGGWIGFDRYMESVLYAPGLGYYSAGARKFGAAGDFVTAPEISPLFVDCLAETAAWVLRRQGGGILEIGAGSGVLAAGLRRRLGELGLGCDYAILETSASLRQVQAETLAGTEAGLAGVTWLDRPPAAFRGLVLANEVLDALPVVCFRVERGQVREYGVGRQGAGFGWRPAPGAGRCPDWLEAGDLPEGYASEYRPMLGPWLATVTGGLEAGGALLLDYGYGRGEYYHPQRDGGTLMCHYRHRAHPDPFLLPGLQDLTAHVDFTAVAEAASAAGLAVAGYTTQLHYLMDSGIDRHLQRRAGAVGGADYLRLAQAAKTLMLPGEMGERFKAIWLARDDGTLPPGFRGKNFLHLL